MGPPIPADSAEAVPVAEPPDDVATVYCCPSVSPSTVIASAVKSTLTEATCDPEASVTVSVSPALTDGEPVSPTSWLSPLASTEPSIAPACPETTTIPPLT